MYSPEWRGRYPHMLRRDVVVWNRFLSGVGLSFVGYDYDVHVGGEVRCGAGWSEKDLHMARMLASKRIDAVGYRAGEVWLFEVKPEAGVTSVGQLVTYRLLYLRQFAPRAQVICALVCSNILPDELWVMEQQGFRTFVV